MDHSTPTAKCCCTAAPQARAPESPQAPAKTRTTVQSVFSALLSVLIAFFPKCPLCWAAYMSVFGSLSIARLPYMGWLLPVLFILLGIHMFLLYKKASRVGYFAFFISLLGALSLLTTRILFPSEKSLLMIGMAFIIAGSLLNSFSLSRLRFASGRQQHLPQS